MAKCVLIHEGEFGRTENVAFPRGTCVGCGQPTERIEGRKLGYGSHYFEGVPTPVCEKCAAIEGARQSAVGEATTTTPFALLVDVLFASGAIVAARMHELPWLVAIALALLVLLVSVLYVEPLFYRLDVARRVRKWSKTHPDWPLSLPVINLWRGLLLPSGEVGLLLAINEHTTGQEWTLMACPSETYADLLAKETGRKAVPLKSPPHIHQDKVVLPGLHTLCIWNLNLRFTSFLVLVFLYCTNVAVWVAPFAHLPLWLKIVLTPLTLLVSWLLMRVVLILKPQCARTFGIVGLL
jgi:hypothetical protein